MIQGQALSLTIGKLAAAGGVGVETVRYYQRRGLLGTPARGTRGGGFRRYGEEDVRRLRFIRSAQASGFTLDRIAELLSLDATNDRARARTMAERQLAVLDARITALQAARDALAALARKCSSDPAGPCPIIGAFDETADDA